MAHFQIPQYWWLRLLWLSTADVVIPFNGQPGGWGPYSIYRSAVSPCCSSIQRTSVIGQWFCRYNPWKMHCIIIVLFSPRLFNIISWWMCRDSDHLRLKSLIFRHGFIISPHNIRSTTYNITLCQLSVGLYKCGRLDNHITRTFVSSSCPPQWLTAITEVSICCTLLFLFSYWCTVVTYRLIGT